jgi:hypothetical protein
VLKGLWWVVAAVSVASAADYVAVGVRQLRAARAAAHPAAV